MPKAKTRVFLVEDDDHLRELYLQLLTSEGYQVSTASNGTSALDKLKQGGFDVVLLDIMLPGIDGIAIIEKLNKSKPVQPNKAIILLTNLTENETIARALKNGADGYIIKSRYTPEEFLEEVKKHIQ